MTFKRVNDYSTDDPVKLDRELSQLEDNIAAEFSFVEDNFAKAVTVDVFRALGSIRIVPFMPGEQLSVETDQADAVVVFPPLTPTNFGRPFSLIKRSSTGNVVLSCSDPNVKYNGGSFPTVTTQGGTRYGCDASGYWRFQ